MEDLTIQENEQVSMVLSGKTLAMVLRGLQAGRYDEVKGSIDAIEEQLRTHVRNRNENVSATSPGALGTRRDSLGTAQDAKQPENPNANNPNDAPN